MKIQFGQLWPFRLVFEKRSAELFLEEANFPECVSKEVRVWRWKRLKTVKVLVHFKDGKFIVKELD